MTKSNTHIEILMYHLFLRLCLHLKLLLSFPHFCSAMAHSHKKLTF